MFFLLNFIIDIFCFFLLFILCINIEYKLIIQFNHSNDLFSCYKHFRFTYNLKPQISKKLKNWVCFFCFVFVLPSHSHKCFILYVSILCGFGYNSLNHRVNCFLFNFIKYPFHVSPFQVVALSLHPFTGIYHTNKKKKQLSQIRAHNTLRRTAFVAGR